MYLCLGILALCAAKDVVSGRIPGRLCFIGLLLSQVYAFAVTGSVRGALYALLAGFMIPVILYPLFAIGGIGAGDLKLMMMLPGFMGIKPCLYAIFSSFCLGAVIGLISLMRQGILKERLAALANYIAKIRRTGKISRYDCFPSRSNSALRTNRIHFTVPLGLGVVIIYGGLIIK